MNPTIGIIGGKGQMGQLFASFFRERGLRVLISDLKTKLTNKELVQEADIVIVSVPIDITAKIIKQVLPHIKKDAAIMDFTSVKEIPVKAMLKGKCEVMGMHPMFGTTNPIPGQTVILCKTPKSAKWSNWMADFLERNQVKTVQISAKEHDKTMAIAQGVIHFSEIAFADVLKRFKMPINELFKFTSKPSEIKVQLVARIIHQDPGLYGNIQMANHFNPKYLREYKNTIDRLLKIIEKKDLKSFTKEFNECKKFFKNYTAESYQESAYLIDKLMENRRRKDKKPITLPKKNSIAVLGPAYTYSDIVATKYLAENKEKLNKYYTKDIDEVFELVAKGKVKMGLVPIENRIHGTVRETLDDLFIKNVHIKEEISLPIHHCLVILSHGDFKKIKKIISHSQALNQCKRYLKKSFPKAEKQAYASTGSAIDKLLRSMDTSLAVIAPALAVNDPKLKIITRNIEDEKENSTSFVVIEKGKVETLGVPGTPGVKSVAKTSIAFHFSADAPGSLFTIFQIFAQAHINLTKIESRPTKSRFGDYIFYLDFEGSLSDSKVEKTLRIVEKKVAKLKVLGSY